MNSCNTLRPPSLSRVWWNLPLCVAIASLSGSLAIVQPILMPYWRRHDMTMSEIWILQGVFAFVLALCQIPSGYWADTVSRKKALLIGTLMCPVGDYLYAFGSSFTDFLIAEVLFGVAIACTNGADGALIYDTLLYRGEGKSNSWWSGMASAGMFLVSAVAAVTGGYIGEIDLRLPFLVTALAASAQVIFIAFLHEPPLERTKKMMGLGALPEVISHCIGRQNGLRWIMAAWCFLGAATWLAVWFYPVYFSATGWSEREQGYIFAGYHLVAGGASLCARHFRGRTELLIPIFMGLAMCTVSAHLLFGLVMASWGILFGALHQICRGVVPVVFGSAVHEKTPSHMRATVFSIQGALITTLYGALTMRLGWAAEVIGFQAVLVAVGATLGCSGLWLWSRRPKIV